MFSSSVLSCCQLPIVTFSGTVFTPTSWCGQAQSVTLWQRQRDSDMLFFRSWVRPGSSCVSWCTKRRKRYSRTTRCHSDTHYQISTPRRPIDPIVMPPITCDVGRQRGSLLRVPRGRRVESIGQHEATKSVLRELVVAPLPSTCNPATASNISSSRCTSHVFCLMRFITADALKHPTFDVRLNISQILL